jgi:hypothetical protein
MGVVRDESRYAGADMDTLESKWLHVQQSICQALNTLKPPSHSIPIRVRWLVQVSKQPCPEKPASSLGLGDFAFYTTKSDDNTTANGDSNWRPQEPRFPPIYNELFVAFTL